MNYFPKTKKFKFSQMFYKLMMTLLIIYAQVWIVNTFRQSPLYYSIESPHFLELLYVTFDWTILLFSMQKYISNEL